MKKHVIITGSSGLIGSELTREFLGAGFHVYGLDIKANPKLKHPDYTFIKTDLSKEASIKAAFKKIKKLDVLVNNGTKPNPNMKSFEKMTLKEWTDGLDGHLNNYFLMCRGAMPLLKKTRGNIINISSTRHKMSEPHTELYTANKGAVDALTRALAVTYSDQVRVNSISPGWIADPQGKFSEADHKQHPAGRVGRPSDIAKMALFLSGEEASFITGQDFVVDGGMTIKMIYQE